MLNLIIKKALVLVSIFAILIISSCSKGDKVFFGFMGAEPEEISKSSGVDLVMFEAYFHNHISKRSLYSLNRYVEGLALNTNISCDTINVLALYGEPELFFHEDNLPRVSGCKEQGYKRYTKHDGRSPYR